MSFNWNDYLSLAKSLADDPGNPGPVEACLRTAISRAYYSALIQSRRFAESEASISTFEKSHQAVIDHFLFPERSSSQESRRKIGNELSRLRAKRVSADYNDTMPDTDHTAAAQATILVAERIIKTLAELIE